MKIYIYFFLYIKMSNKYYQKHKEKLKKTTRERYQNLSQEEKEKSVSIIMDVIRIFLRNKSIIFFKDPMVIKVISWISR